MFEWDNGLQSGLKGVNTFTPEDEYKRSMLDRVLGTIQNTSITNALYNTTDSDPTTGIIEGITDGVTAMNPFDDDVREGTHTTSDVLSNIGINPQTTAGKVVKGGVSLVGDILTDPLTYLNPFSAVGKIVSGTGKVVNGASKSALTMEQATKVVKSIYVQRGVDASTIHPDAIKTEAEDLLKSFNSKIMKIKEGGEDFQVGMKNLPFTNKIKVDEDKTLDSFNKTIMSAEKLRGLGDKTVAPYYQQMINKLRTTKAYGALNKNADLMKKAVDDPESAAMAYKLERMHKGFSPNKIDKDLGAMSATNKASDMFSDLTPEEQSSFVKRYENGEFKSWFQGRDVLDKQIDKVKGNTDASTKTAELKKSFDEKTKQMQEEMKVDKGRYYTALRKGRYDGAINEFMNGFDGSKGLMTAEDTVLDAQIKEGLVDDKMESILKRYGYLDQPDGVKMPNGTTVGKSEKPFDKNDDVIDEALSDMKGGFTIQSDIDLTPHRAKFERGGELRNEIIKMMKGEMSPDARKSVDTNNLFTPESKEELTKEINSKLFGGEEVLSAKMSDKVFNEMNSAIQKNDAHAFRRSISDVYAVGNKDINAKEIWDESMLRTKSNLTSRWFARYDSDEVIDGGKSYIKDQYTKVRKIDIPRNNAYYFDNAKNKNVNVPLQDIPKMAQDFARYKELGGFTGIDKRIDDVAAELEHIQMVSKSYPKGYFTKRMRQLSFQVNHLTNLASMGEKKTLINSYVKYLGLKNVDELAKVNPKLLQDYGEMINQNRLSLYNDVHGTKFGNERDVYYNPNRENFIDEKQGELTGNNNKEYAGTPENKDYQATDDELMLFAQKYRQKDIGVPDEVASIAKASSDRGIIKDTVKENWSKLDQDMKDDIARHYKFANEDAIRKEINSGYKNWTVPSAVEKDIDDDAVEAIKKAASDESPETAETMEEIADILHIGSPSDREMKLAKYIEEHMQELAENEIRVGRLSTEQVDAMRGKYIPHMMTDDAKQWVLKNLTKDFEASGGFNPKTFAVGYEKKFNDKRIYKTIEEANEALKAKTGVDKWFEDDVIKIMQARSLASNRLVFNDEMTQAVRKIAGKPYEAGQTLEGHTAVCSFVDLNNKLRRLFEGEVPDEVLAYLDIDKRMFSPNNAYIDLDDTQIDKIRQLTSATPDGRVPPVDFFNLEDEMMTRLNRESAIQKRMQQGELTKIYDKWLMIWKLNNTTITPGFHIQNAVSNAFQSFMSDGKAVLEPSRIKQANDIFRNTEPTKMIKIGDYNFTSEQYRLLAEQYGILDNTFFDKDIRFGMEDGGMLGKFGVKGKYDPTDVNEFIPYRKGAEIGSHIEGTQRLSLFLKGLEDGKTIEESVENVNKFLFDYGDLTEFEKTTMKRVIPFYTFMRKNIPLQLEQIFAQPFLYATTDRILDNIDKASGDDHVDRSERNPWYQEFTQLPFKVNNRNVGINLQLPQQQLDRLTPRKIFGQTTPLIKTPVEAVKGEYIYTGIPIKNPLEYLLNQTQYTKMGNTASQKEGSAKEMYILGQLTGLPMGELNK